MGKSISEVKTPVFIKLMYALGQMGWSLAAYGIANLLIYYYMPPQTENNTSVFPAYIYQGAVFGFGTIIGLLAFSGRLFDAITDPLIANWSDRATYRFGKRRLLMLLGFIPFALFSFLIFIPLTPFTSSANVVWLFITVMFLYLFMTIYVVPYSALISELGHSPGERLTISSLISVTFALGYGIGTQVFTFQHLLEKHFLFSHVEAFRWVIAGYAVLAAILMAIPVIFVNEAKYCVSKPTNESPYAAIRSLLNNRNFKFFAVSDLMYWLALTFIQMGIAYYVSVLLQLDVQYSSMVLTGMLGLSFVFYVPVNILARKWGKKHLMVLSFAWFTILYFMLAFLGKYPFHSVTQIVLLGIFGSIPIAIFSILPNAVVADMVEADAIETGGQKAAIFFAARSFMMKMGISLANLIFPSLLLMGNSIENPTGIRTTAIVAAFFCMLGALFFYRYDEDETLRQAKLYRSQTYASSIDGKH